jgi:hypothetical protein
VERPPWKRQRVLPGTGQRGRRRKNSSAVHPVFGVRRIAARWNSPWGSSPYGPLRFVSKLDIWHRQQDRQRIGAELNWRRSRFA